MNAVNHLPGSAQAPGSTALATDPLVVRAEKFRARSSRSLFARRERLILGLVGLVVILGLWQLNAVVKVEQPIFTSYPSQIAQEMVHYFDGGSGWTDIRVSMTEFGLGFGLTLLIGIPLGILIGWYRRLDALIGPTIDFFYNMPRIAFAPLMVIWFGLGEGSKIAIVLLSALFPLLISVQVAVAFADTSLISMARSYGANDFTILRSIVIPGSIPAISTGIRLGIGHGLAGVVLAEFIASTKGLGFTVNQASSVLNVALMFDAIIVIGLIGVILTWLLRAVERKFEKWRI